LGQAEAGGNENHEQVTCPRFLYQS
jgi:hypothetical protein